MGQGLDFLRNVVSPQEEMSAYETLWAIEGIKENRLYKKDQKGKQPVRVIEGIKESLLKKLFKECIPSEALKKVSEKYEQRELFATEHPFKKLQDEVDKFLQDSLGNKRSTFSIVINRSVQYPENLINDYPIGLFYYKGNLDILGLRCISIVGARKASSEGILKARQLAKELTAEKFVIVSGLAKGIDTAAHQSAIKNKGLTIGVIGTPIDQYYPPGNESLQDKIAKDFLLISQVPFYKYAHEPFKHRGYHFPRRNMAMASISKATVIVEASDISGSLVQARECLKQNKQLFIMDSCFKNKEIKWPFSYEKKGAVRVKTIEDILKYF